MVVFCMLILFFSFFFFEEGLALVRLANAVRNNLWFGIGTGW